MNVKLVMALSLLPAYILTALPLPEWLQTARPEWVALVLIYWAIALPQHLAAWFVFAAGIILDAMQGGVLGQNALSLLCVTVIVQLLYQRLRLFTQLQQVAVVFCLLSLHLLVGQWLRNALIATPPSESLLLAAISSAVLWPLMFFSLRALRRAWVRA